MQIRCYHCHKPFALGKEATHLALDELVDQNLGHYNVQCPHFRRVNRVSKDELLRAAPDWKASQAEQSTVE